MGPRDLIDPGRPCVRRLTRQWHCNTRHVPLACAVVAPPHLLLSTNNWIADNASAHNVSHLCRLFSHARHEILCFMAFIQAHTSIKLTIAQPFQDLIKSSPSLCFCNQCGIRPAKNPLITLNSNATVHKKNAFVVFL